MLSTCDNSARCCAGVSREWSKVWETVSGRLSVRTEAAHAPIIVRPVCDVSVWCVSCVVCIVCGVYVYVCSVCVCMRVCVCMECVSLGVNVYACAPV